MRLSSIDALRGVLILLMVYVHGLYWLGGVAVGQWLLAVLFCVVAGALAGPVPSSRYVQLVGAALVSAPPFLALGIGWPILSAIAVAYPALWILPRTWAPVVGVAVFWLIDYTGGPVSLAAAALGLGIGAGLRYQVLEAAGQTEDRPAVRVLESLGCGFVGRWPLTVYVGHVWAFSALSGGVPW